MSGAGGEVNGRRMGCRAGRQWRDRSGAGCESSGARRVLSFIFKPLHAACRCLEATAAFQK